MEVQGCYDFEEMVFHYPTVDSTKLTLDQNYEKDSSLPLNTQQDSAVFVEETEGQKSNLPDTECSNKICVCVICVLRYASVCCVV